MNLSWNHMRSHKNMGPIGSAILTFNGLQTKKHQNRQAKNIDRYNLSK